MEEHEELLTAGDVARITGLSRQRINQLASEGKLGRQIAGRYWVFTREEAEQYKAAPKSKGGRPPKLDALPLQQLNITNGRAVLN